MVLAARPAPDDRVLRTEHTVAGARVRTYAPDGSTEPLPGILYLHGGGFVAFSIDAFDSECERLALEAGALVAAVEYRLAPEHPFPAAIDDCYAALEWLAARVDRFAVVGESAGGGLAAGLALLTRDRGGPQPALQMLLCPCLDDRLETPSSHAVTDPRTWCRVAAEGSWAAYLGGAEPTSPYAAAARAEDLAGLPPAYVGIGECDLMHDEAVAYAERLAAAGVPTELHVYPGAFHRFEAVVPGAHVSIAALGHRHGALRRALHPSPA